MKERVSDPWEKGIRHFVTFLESDIFGLNLCMERENNGNNQVT